MTLLRVKAVWRGLAGGTGVNILHFGNTPEYSADAVNTVAQACYTFYQEVQKWIPNSVSVTIDQQIEEIRDTDGEILNIYGGPALTQQTGLQTGGYAAPAGAVLHWMTGDVANGRRVRGRTFIVPLAGAVYENNGTLIAGAMTGLSAAANVLLANEAAQLSVWRRPPRSTEDGVLPKGTIIGDGSQHRVTGVRIPDKAAMLTSRRD